MGNLNPRGDLAAVEIAFYAPAFVVGVFIVFQHGFSRQLGWLYIVLLSILRLIGGSCTLYSETNNDYSSSLLEAAAITSAVGTAPLLLALMGFLERVHEGMNQRADEHAGGGLPAPVWRVLHLVPLVGLVLSIVGGTFESEQGNVSTGRACMEAAAILFLLIMLSLAAITFFTVLRISHVISNERKLVYAGLLALPFLLVRIIYTVISSFAKPGSDFYFRDVGVVPQALMQFTMEAVVVILFITAGLLTPRKPQYPKNSAVKGQRDSSFTPLGYDMGSPQPGGQSRDDGRAGGERSGQRGASTQPKNLGDYRPSRMIANAISTRR